MRKLPDKSINLIVTDPPYGIGINKMNFTISRKGGLARRGDYKGKADWDKRLAKEYFDEMFRVSKNQVIFGGNYYTDVLPPTRCWLVWDKKVKDKYSNDFADAELIWTSFDKNVRVIRWLWHGMIQQDMKNKEKRYHPTQKPVAVVRKILEMFSNRYDIILDPFIGSGSTAVACVELGRFFLGFEIDPRWVSIAEKRLSSVQLGFWRDDYGRSNTRLKQEGVRDVKVS